MNLLDKFHFKDKNGHKTTMEICDSFSRSKIAEVVEMIPTRVSQLVNDSGYALKSYVDQVVALIPTKTSDLQNDSGFITSADIPRNVSSFVNDADYATNVRVDQVANSIPVIAANYTAPFTKLRIGDKAVLYGTVASQTIAVTNQYVVNTAYYADVNISIPTGARLSALASVSVQTINGLGLLSVDILEQEIDHIKVRLFSPKSESITLGFSVIIIGNN